MGDMKASRSLGLVLRRHLAHALSVPGLCATFLVALPIGLVLGGRAQHWAAGAGAYLWTFLHFVSFAPLRHTVWATGSDRAADITVWVLLNAATLVAWSWAAGWALGVFARRETWIPMLAFYGAVVLVALTRHDIGTVSGHPAFAAFGMVAAVTAAHSALLVIAPALYGLRLSLSRRPLSVTARVGCALGITLLTYRAVAAPFMF